MRQTLFIWNTPIIQWTGIPGVMKPLKKQKQKTGPSSFPSAIPPVTGAMFVINSNLIGIFNTTVL